MELVGILHQGARFPRLRHEAYSLALESGQEQEQQAVELCVRPCLAGFSKNGSDYLAFFIEYTRGAKAEALPKWA